MFVFRIHGTLEADISSKMPFEVSFSRDKNNLFTVSINVSTLIYSICNTLTISLSAIKRDFAHL